MEEDEGVENKKLERKHDFAKICEKVFRQKIDIWKN